MFEVQVKVCVLSYKCLIALAPFVEETTFPSLNFFYIFVKYQFTWVYFWILCFVALIYVPIPPAISLCLDHCSYITSFKQARMTPPTVFFSVKIIIVSTAYLPFHINFTIILYISTKTLTGILVGITLNLHINLGSIDIFIMRSLPINEHDISHHLFSSCLISLIIIFYF